MEELRSNNIFNLEDVQYAIVETNGKLSVMLKYKAQTVTPEILNLKGSDPKLPAIVISDGVIIEHALKNCNLGKPCLLETVKSNHLQVSDIFLMTADANAKYYIIPRQAEKKNG